MKCQNCKSKIELNHMYKCKNCHQPVCQNCADQNAMVCKNCGGDVSLLS